MLLPWNGGRQQLAAAPVVVTVEREHRTLVRSTLTRLGWMLPTSSVFAMNNCLANAGSVTTTTASEHREVQCERVAVAAGASARRSMCARPQKNALHELRERAAGGI